MLKMIRASWLYATLTLVGLGSFHLLSSTPDDSTARPALQPIAPKPQLHDVVHEIAKGDTLGTILAPFGLNPQRLRKAAMEVTDLAQIRTGRVLTFKVMEGETKPRVIEYPLDEDNTLRLMRDEEGWSAEKHTIVYDIVEGNRAFEVEHTFWGSAIEAGLRGTDIATLAQVFEFDVDFNTELRKGASVQMVVEELYHQGQMVKLGRPLAVKFNNNGSDFVAVRHVSKDGSTGYFDMKGVARKKAFLRSPLTFSRVTSGFNPKRFHPVLKRRRPHNGTDFGAPTGTPVRATGDGVITHAGWNGGHGKFVKIDHRGPYQSSYSHLHRIKVRRGQKVKQGQVIGHVGSTGMSTGPHLHYQFWKNGRFVDAMRIDLPRTQKLPSSEMAVFGANRDMWLDFLEGNLPTVAMSEG